MSTTKERIIDVALSLFAERGVGATSVVDIEAGAGLSPGSGSFYRHFPSKEAVLAAVIEREVARVEASRSNRDGQPADLASEYERIMDDLAGMSSLMQLLAHDGSQLGEVLDPVREVLAEQGASFEGAALAQRMEGGEIQRRDPDAVASVAMFALVGRQLAETFFGAPIGVDRHRFAATLAELVTGSPPS